MQNNLETLEDLIKSIESLKQLLSSFEKFKDVPTEIINIILETEMDYCLQNLNSIGKEEREKVKTGVDVVRKRIMLLHHDILTLHFPDDTQQGVVKNQSLELVNKSTGLLRKIELSV